jgi:DNA-binding HxlR family transcriptional regulator
VKSYGQRCPLARALDRIGERWTLLVVRELMLGPRRYTDLLDGLPGVGTNILAARLADLQEAGLVSKQTLPPPTAVTVYELTDAGLALAPALQALREWGEQHGAPATDAQAVRPGWILQSVARRGALLAAGRSCEIRVGRDVFELAAGGERLSLTAAPARSPDAILTLEPSVLYALASGRLAPRAARGRVQIEGDKRLAADVLAAIGGVASGAHA